MPYYTKAALEQLIQSAYKIGVFSKVNDYLRSLLASKSSWVNKRYTARIIDVTAKQDDMLLIRVYAKRSPSTECLDEQPGLSINIRLMIVKNEREGKMVTDESREIYHITLDEMKHLEALLKNECE